MSEFSSFNYVDIGILGVLIFSVVMGLRRGFVSEVVSLVAIIAAFIIAGFYANPMAVYFAKNQSSTPVSHLAIGVCFTILFLAVLLLGAVIRKALNTVIKVAMLSTVNRLFGGLFGFLRGCLYIIVAVFLIQLSPIAENKSWQEAKTVLLFQPLVTWLSEQANPLTHSPAFPANVLDR